MESNREFDSPWKEAIEVFLEPLLAFFFGDLHEAIDWSKGYVSLDKEFHESLRDSAVGSSLADKLFKVYLKDGSDVWLLIHFEVQAQPAPDFARRMFVYYYRIFDRYNRDIVSLAILADERERWRPTQYRKEVFNCLLDFRFRTVKLIDWLGREEELHASSNVSAFAILAHLYSLTTHGDQDRRRAAKWRLIREVFNRGYTADMIRQLYRLIDWFLELPAALHEQLQNDVYDLEKQMGIPYVTSTERLARKQGLDEGLQLGLRQGLRTAIEIKFGGEGQALAAELEHIEELQHLNEIEAALRTTKTADEFKAILDRMLPVPK